MSPDLSILLVTYHCRDVADACLASIEATKGDLTCEVVLVDNDSRDGTVEMVRERYPSVRLIASPENLGFAAGVNRAADEAAGEYLLLLNPDTVVHEGALRALLDFARAHPEHGLYGGRTLDPDGTVNPGSCWGAPTLWSLTCYATMLTTAFRRTALFDPESLGDWKRDTVREVDIITGCLLLAPRALWRELGGFDTRFFMYGEDADLSFRARALGYRPVIVPEAVITHEVGVSSQADGEKYLYLHRGKATLLRKHWHGLRLRTGLGLLLVGVGVRALVSVLARRPEARSAYVDVWRRREEWLEGYPEPAEAPGPTVARGGEVGTA